MADRNPFRTLKVIRTQSLTPNMRRITVGGPELRGFPEQQESGYIKLILSSLEHADASGPSLAGSANINKPLMRTYTIRRFDTNTLELDIDFVVHGDNGPASAWAINAEAGDSVTISGPGGKKMVDMSADWFFIAGDMTALPAIGVNLEQLPEKARGYAVIEIIDRADQQPLNAPPGIEIHWIVNPFPCRPNIILTDAVRKLPWQEGRVNVWVASEFETMRQLRRYFKHEKHIPREDMYVSSYWKIGETDEGNKLAKRSDIESN